MVSQGSGYPFGLSRRRHEFDSRWDRQENIQQNYWIIKLISTLVFRQFKSVAVFCYNITVVAVKSVYKQRLHILRRVAVVAKRSHKPTVGGSNPPARNESTHRDVLLVGRTTVNAIQLMLNNGLGITCSKYKATTPVVNVTLAGEEYISTFVEYFNFYLY